MPRVLGLLVVVMLAWMVPSVAQAEEPSPVAVLGGPAPEGEPAAFMNPRAFEADGYRVVSDEFSAGESVVVRVDGNDVDTVSADDAGRLDYRLDGFAVSAGTVVTIDLVGAEHEVRDLLGIEEPFIVFQPVYTASSLTSVGMAFDVRAVDRGAAAELFVAGERIGEMSESDYRINSGWVKRPLGPGVYEVVVELDDGTRLAEEFEIVADTFAVSVTPSEVPVNRLADGVVVAAEGLLPPGDGPGGGTITVSVRGADGGLLEAPAPEELTTPVGPDGRASVRLPDSVIQALRVGQRYTVYVLGDTGRTDIGPAVGEISSASFAVLDAESDPQPTATPEDTRTLPRVGGPSASVPLGGAALALAGGFALVGVSGRLREGRR